MKRGKRHYLAQFEITPNCLRVHSRQGVLRALTAKMERDPGVSQLLERLERGEIEEIVIGAGVIRQDPSA